MNVKFAHMLLDAQGEILLRQISRIQTGIVRTAGHPIRIFDAIKEAIRDIPYMNIISLEIFLEDDEVALGGRGIDEMIHQKIKAHPRRHTKDGRESQSDHIRVLQEFLFGLSFRLAVERYRLQRRFFGTENISGLCAVAAVRSRIYD